MTRKKRGVLLVALGLVMVLAATALYALNDRKDAQAGQNADWLLYELSREMENRTPMPAGLPDTEAESTEEQDYPEMAEADYNGMGMIGILRVPSCGIELPVLSQWSYELLEYAPCRYSGNIYAGDLILMGHNYRSHFKPLKSVELGAEITFTDVNGVTWVYTVDRIDSINRNAPELLPSEEHELSLFTCEDYNVYRFVARCKLVEVRPAEDGAG